MCGRRRLRKLKSKSEKISNCGNLLGNADLRSVHLRKEGW